MKTWRANNKAELDVDGLVVIADDHEDNDDVQSVVSSTHAVAGHERSLHNIMDSIQELLYPTSSKEKPVGLTRDDSWIIEDTLHRRVDNTTWPDTSMAYCRLEMSGLSPVPPKRSGHKVIFAVVFG